MQFEGSLCDPLMSIVRNLHTFSFHLAIFPSGEHTYLASSIMTYNQSAYQLDHEQRYQAVLLDYVAGNLPRGPAFVVAAHLALQPHACAYTQIFDSTGGALLDALEPVAISAPNWLESDTTHDNSMHALRPQNDVAHVLSSIDQGRWRRNLTGMLTMQLTGPLSDCDVELLKLEAGRKVPEHGHQGLELTLVLTGSLDDGGQIYRRGHLLVHDEGSEHQPGAEAGSDCICLIAQTAPIRLIGPLGWLINRFS
ncbi:ChrR family anti-sigma-E factor [Candidatus Phycosocius spiralis]|uniref:Anti-sigma-E factor ChrR n=1 Tax=Candidatus Phycosocius spiralis TaxID=2815099 RepID=A0ABQ4PT88_9PROT|nr:ChrR family anti-sigma-E factor [Candidatus Phycosocius spiralis]GIU66207.1 anti-sigma-E factor ChrR [Candidatus Phycosocius spiralis]